VFAARTVAGFTARLTTQGCHWGIDACVGAGGKTSRDICVAVVASLVANVIRPGNFGRSDCC
jgi:hypothetical protein